ncbi:hypothetical protein ACFYXF_04105 [Streptomyces sp. NPDC002680]|uniref:hypothetical protein n=1 Tax=Streptomyces sp. NPDC002680 TaxID=3364659 RepID=UPI0036BDFF60
MTRDRVPAPVQPTDPTLVPQQSAIGAGVPAAILQGAVQGAARSVTARMADKFLSNSPDCLKALWDMLPRPWDH